MNNKQELLTMLEHIKSQVEEGAQFVCNLSFRYVRRKFDLNYYEAIFHPLHEEVLEMVGMHIGKEESTMESFVAEKLGYRLWECPPEDIVKSYRIAMLNNMIKMVKGEPHA